MNEAMLAVAASNDNAQLQENPAMISAAVAPLIPAGKARGVPRDDVTVDDLLTVKAAVLFAGPQEGPRLAAILIDGLRHGAQARGRRRAKQQRRRTKRS